LRGRLYTAKCPPATTEGSSSHRSHRSHRSPATTKDASSLLLLLLGLLLLGRAKGTTTTADPTADPTAEAASRSSTTESPACRQWCPEGATPPATSKNASSSSSSSSGLSEATASPKHRGPASRRRLSKSPCLRHPCCRQALHDETGGRLSGLAVFFVEELPQLALPPGVFPQILVELAEFRRVHLLVQGVESAAVVHLPAGSSPAPESSWRTERTPATSGGEHRLGGGAEASRSGGWLAEDASTRGGLSEATLLRLGGSLPEHAGLLLLLLLSEYPSRRRPPPQSPPQSTP